LEEHFSSYGDVTSVKILIDNDTGRSRGCGFVNYATKIEQSLAVDKGHNSIMLGRSLDVREAEDRRPQRAQQSSGREWGAKDWKRRQSGDDY
jgi:RNA recognition motif-containing protein